MEPKLDRERNGDGKKLSGHVTGYLFQTGGRIITIEALEPASWREMGPGGEM